MSARNALDACMEAWQILARDGDIDRTNAERDRGAAHRAKLIDAYAHELAEQQREFVRRQASDPFHYGSAQWAIKGVDEAADHISPSAGPVRPGEETT